MDPRTLLGIPAGEEDPIVIQAAYEAKKKEGGVDERRLRDAYDMLMAWSEYGAGGPGVAFAQSRPLEMTTLELDPSAPSLETELPSMLEPEPMAVSEMETVPEAEPAAEPETERETEPEPLRVTVKGKVSPLAAWDRVRRMPPGPKRDDALRHGARALADVMDGSSDLVAAWSDGLIDGFGKHLDLLTSIVRDDDIIRELKGGRAGVSGRVLRHVHKRRDFRRLSLVAQRVLNTESEAIDKQARKGLHLWLAKCLALAYPYVAHQIALKGVEAGRPHVHMSDSLATKLAAGNELEDWPPQQREAAARILLDGYDAKRLGEDGERVLERVAKLPATSALRMLLEDDLPALPRRQRKKKSKSRKARKREKPKKKDSSVTGWVVIGIVVWVIIRACG